MFVHGRRFDGKAPGTGDDQQRMVDGAAAETVEFGPSDWLRPAAVLL
jgi:hypothetical protein